MQTRFQSLIESFMNILVGYGINFAGNWFILPLFGCKISIAQNIQIGLLFTIISVVRSYGLRRFFNWFHSMQGLKECQN